MVEEESFKTEKYDFVFYEDEHFRRTNTIQGNVMTAEGRDVNDDDLRELRLFLDDIGKWENFSIATRNLLEDLGMIARKGTVEPMKELGIEKYNVEMQKHDQLIRITIRLTPEERHRRASRQSMEFRLKEITEQVKNIPKWRMLTKTLLDLRKRIDASQKLTNL